MTLSVDKISCSRNDRMLFQNISFTLHGGELIQVMGNNGSGKSSLLRIIAGLLQPESGAIFWSFEPNLFYLGHTLAIKSQLTVHENLSLSNNNYSILQNWSLENLQHHLCGTLSQGQRQRVALARLQLSNTKIWILDEPFSYLDEAGILQLEKVLQLHLEKEGTCVMATHRKIELSSRIIKL